MAEATEERRRQACVLGRPVARLAGTWAELDEAKVAGSVRPDLLDHVDEAIRAVRRYVRYAADLDDDRALTCDAVGGSGRCAPKEPRDHQVRDPEHEAQDRKGRNIQADIAPAMVWALRRRGCVQDVQDREDGDGEGERGQTSAEVGREAIRARDRVGDG